MSNRTMRLSVRISAFCPSVWAGVWALAFCIAPANAVDTLPSVDEIRGLIASGEYHEAIVDANRLLTLRADLAAGIDRGEVLALRGEGDLGLKLRSSAIDSFTAAAKASSDPKQADEAEATQILIQKSPGFHYLAKRKTSPAATQPIDIIPEDTRPSAFAALYADQSDAAKADIARASAATSLPPIVSTLKTFHRLKIIEEAATGSDAQTLKSSDSVAEHAASLITNALNQMNLQVQAIAKQSQASAQSPFGGQGNGNQGNGGQGMGSMGGQSQNKRSGLSSDQVATLQQTVATCQKISTVLTELKEVSDNTAAAALPQQVQSLSNQATQLLAANAQSASAGGQSNGNSSSSSGGPGMGSGSSTGGTGTGAGSSSGGSAGSGQNGPGNGRPPGRPPAG